MREFGRFGPLIGAIDEGTSNVKFLVFAANTSEVLTYHQLPLRRFSPQEGWVEQDALEILAAVIECIEVTVVVHSSNFIFSYLKQFEPWRTLKKNGNPV